MTSSKFKLVLKTVRHLNGRNSTYRWFASTLLAFGLVLMATSGVLALAQTPTKGLPEPKDPAVRDRERKALVEFYDALGGHDWIERDFWSSEKPVGQWHGVTTDADGFVTTLTIYDNNLTGPMSAAICQLQRLHTLHLSFNKISGSLPDKLGDCRALKNLWVKGNKITGRLPDSVAVLPELEYLDLHANEMSGPLPTVWNTPKLKIVRAEDNRISGELPAQLLRQPLLEHVFMHNNGLSFCFLFATDFLIRANPCNLWQTSYRN